MTGPESDGPGAAAWPQSTAGRIMPAQSRFPRLIPHRLIRGREIPCSEVRVKGWKAARLNKFDIDLAIFPITHLITWTISDNVLVTKFNSDFGRYIRQFTQIFHHKVAAAGRFREIAEHFR